MSEQKEVGYIKGEPLDTAEKFVKWVAQKKPYYFTDILMLENRNAGFYYYQAQMESRFFQAIKKPKPVVKRLYAYQLKGYTEIIFRTHNDCKLDSRRLDFDIIYPEQEGE